jgi:hypothetical protein
MAYSKTVPRCKPRPLHADTHGQAEPVLGLAALLGNHLPAYQNLITSYKAVTRR